MQIFQLIACTLLATIALAHGHQETHKDNDDRHNTHKNVNVVNVHTNTNVNVNVNVVFQQNVIVMGQTTMVSTNTLNSIATVLGINGGVIACGRVIQSVCGLGLQSNWQQQALLIAQSTGVTFNQVVQIAQRVQPVFVSSQFAPIFTGICNLQLQTINTAPTISATALPVFQNQCIVLGGQTIVQTNVINSFVTTNTGLGLTMTTCGGIIQAIGALTGNWQVGAVNIANTFNVQPSVVVQVASHFGSYFRNFNRFNACFNAVSGLNFATAPAMSTVSTPLVFQNQCITFGGATVIQTRAINNFISTNTNLGLTMQTCGGIIQAIGALGTNANWGTACTAIAGQFGISARTVSIVANAFMPMVQQIGQVYPSFQGVAAVSSEVGLGGGIVYDASFDNTNATDVASSASVSRSVAVGGLFAFALLFI